MAEVADGRSAVEGRLVLASEVRTGRLVIEGGRIAEVELRDGDGDDDDGPYVCPGFVDVHVHGWGGHDAMGDERALDGMARALLRRGVTSFLPTGVTAPMDVLRAFAERVRAWIPGAPADGADPLGFDIEGPFISAARKGAQNPDHIADPRAVGREMLEPLLEGLRVMTVAPEVPGALELIEWLTARGVRVSAGHSSSDIDAARAGYAAGAATTTHLFNAMSGVDHHAPGLAVAALSDDDAYVELIADGHHVHPALWPIITRTKPADRLLLVSDAVPLAGTDQRRASIGGMEVEVERDRCTVAGTQTLAGSVIALDSAVRNLVASGVGLPAAVAAASRNPLRLLGVDDRGTLAPGQRADLVELDVDLRVRRVMKAGTWMTAG